MSFCLKHHLIWMTFIKVQTHSVLTELFSNDRQWVQYRCSGNISCYVTHGLDTEWQGQITTQPFPNCGVKNLGGKYCMNPLNFHTYCLHVYRNYDMSCRYILKLHSISGLHPIQVLRYFHVMTIQPLRELCV